MTARAAFHIDGLRWIASLLHAAADRLEKPADEPVPMYISARDPVDELRARLQERYF